MDSVCQQDNRDVIAGEPASSASFIESLNDLGESAIVKWLIT